MRKNKMTENYLWKKNYFKMTRLTNFFLFINYFYGF